MDAELKVPGRTGLAVSGDPGEGESDSDLLPQLIHDLKNPLSVILTFAELVTTVEGGEREDLCKRLQVNAHRALQVLEEFALLSDLRHQQVEPCDAECEWAMLIRKVAIEMATQGTACGRSIVCDVEGSCMLRAEPSHLELMLRCLLREALQAVSGGGSLRLSLETSANRAVLRLMVPRSDQEMKGSPLLDRDSTHMEFVRRVAELYGGRVSLGIQPSGETATVRLPRPMGP